MWHLSLLLYGWFLEHALTWMYLNILRPVQCTLASLVLVCFAFLLIHGCFIRCSRISPFILSNFLNETGLSLHIIGDTLLLFMISLNCCLSLFGCKIYVTKAIGNWWSLFRRGLLVTNSEFYTGEFVITYIMVMLHLCCVGSNCNCCLWIAHDIQ